MEKVKMAMTDLIMCHLNVSRWSRNDISVLGCFFAFFLVDCSSLIDSCDISQEIIRLFGFLKFPQI